MCEISDPHGSKYEVIALMMEAEQHLQIVGKLLSDYMGQHFRRQSPSV
jgi:hypothetical protein